MTPKEKAKDLFNKYYLLIDIKNYENTKQCALIAVDEILAIFYDDYQSMWVRELNFWHLVKQEIEAL
jgi:hypothetical protein